MKRTPTPIRTAVAAFSASALTLSSLTIAPVAVPTAVATETAPTLATANASMDANLNSLNQQAGDLNGQIGEVNGVIGQLEAEYAALVPVLAQKQALLKETVKEAYIAGEPSSLEVVASNQTFSGVVAQQHYRDQIGSKTQKAAEDLEATKQQLNQKLAEAGKKRDSLTALKVDLDEKLATAQAQAQAKAALAVATQNKEEEFQKMMQEQRSQEAAALVGAASPAPPAPSARPSAGPTPSSGGGSVSSVRGGSNPYPYGQCTWLVYDMTGRGQNGNAGTWRPTSSTPAVGKIMIWRAGEAGATGAGHVAVVVGVNGNQVTVREMNWNGWGVVSTRTTASTGKFY